MAEWVVAKRKFEDLIDQLLYNRGVFDKKDDKLAELFFYPDFQKDLPDPFLMKNLEKAVLRIKKAKEQNETVGIFADYDADGIPGAALLYKALTKIGLKTVVYIPNRESGYGLSKEGIDYLVSSKCSLIITVDLGIRSIKEAEYCKEIGLDLVITDHHLPGKEIPDIETLINPKQQGDKYPFKELCGCGVAYKLVQGLSNIYPKVIDESFLKWNLDLVAISSICDVVPLNGENRILAKFGLRVLQKTRNLGLCELISEAQLEKSVLTAYHVGFQLGPRINAPGRIDHATKSFELLITDDQGEARELASWLNQKNEERQAAMEVTQREAIQKVSDQGLDRNKIIIIAGKWPKGVIGPSASKLVEKYNRPVILFSEEKESLTGSARSVPGVNIVLLFEKVSDTIYKFGGHKGAAGITVKKDQYDLFVKNILHIAQSFISSDDLVKKIKVDCPVEIHELTKGLYEKLLLFEPFGMENSKPVFLLNDINFSSSKFVGKGSDHLSSLTCKGSSKIKSIYFNFPYEKDMIRQDKCYDIVFNLSLDEWQGNANLSFNIIDLRAHD